MSTLPILPLPHLETTHKELLTWIQPLLTEDEFIQSKKEIDTFFQSDNVGEILQEKLQAHKNNDPTNWLAPLWNDLYLTHRGKLHTDLHYHVVIAHENFARTENKQLFTARFLQKMTEFYHLIIDDALYSEKIIPDIISDDQFSHLFKANRVPHEVKDTFLVGKKDKRNNYVVFLHKQRFYPLYLTDNTGELIDEACLIQAINTIVTSNSDINEAPIGYLTTAMRHDAATIYNELIEDESNQTNFNIINDALAFIHFDDESDNGLTALERLFLNGVDKYYDKTLQFSITNQHEIGVSVEHTAIDATTILTLFEYITTHFNEKTNANIISLKQPDIHSLKWNVPDQLLNTLHTLEVQNQADVGNFILLEKVINTVGTDLIKQAKFSPDAFFHMALQIASYSTFDQVQNTYEAVAMRTYQKGRTECNRPTTMQTLELAKYYTTENATPENILSLMHQAQDEHRRRIRNCVTGKGIERHLFGLEAMYYQYGHELGLTAKPSLFESTGYIRLKHDVLSTTNISHPLISQFIFGPVVENGYGIYYSLLPNSININISAQSEDIDKATLLVTTFENVVLDLLRIAKNNKDEASS